MRRLVIPLLFVLANCGGPGDPQTTAPTTPSAVPTTAVAQTPSTTSSSPPPTTTTATTTTISTTQPPPTVVSEPGTHDDAELVIHLSFESQIEDVSSEQFAEQSIAILNANNGWGRAGFSFVADPASSLRVVLAEGPEVDALCLPLETFGKVSCQNGPVVALNADRWRLGGDDWDGTIEFYRTYLVNHEVGHLIGLRHPLERCPTDTKVSALMEPQTNNLLDCRGNGIPLDWEIEWAKQRPATIGPNPDWDGPQPSWPAGS